jgi:hypothetical protein
LGSPGGDLLEAIKIGRLIRKLRFATFSPSMLAGTPISVAKFRKENLVCSSSCFFILAAGVLRLGGIIGIHRPYLPKEHYQKIGAGDAIEVSKKIRIMLTDYLRDMGTPTSYVDRMYSIPKEKVEWLLKKETNNLFSGLIPDIDEWVKARCPGLQSRQLHADIGVAIGNGTLVDDHTA